MTRTVDYRVGQRNGSTYLSGVGSRPTLFSGTHVPGVRKTLGHPCPVTDRINRSLVRLGEVWCTLVLLSGRSIVVIPLTETGERSEGETTT